MNTPNYFRHAMLTAFASTALLFGNAAMAQEIPSSQVPAPVLAAFDKAFSGAMDVEWHLKGTQYKVEFETGILFTDHDAWYDASGKLLMHEEEISTSDLPAAVQASIAKEFPGLKMDDAERVTTDGAVSYRVELKGAGAKWEVAYDSNGKLLEKRAD
jgi:hypothetical protein